MSITPAVVRAERDRVLAQTPAVVHLLNEVRADLADEFDADVPTVDQD